MEFIVILEMDLILTEDMDIYAVFKPVKRIYYTVNFCNYDGTVLQSVVVEQGQTAYYTGETPSRPSDNYCKYSFAGWDLPNDNIQRNMTIIALFAAQSLLAGDIENGYSYGRVQRNGRRYRKQIRYLRL